MKKLLTIFWLGLLIFSLSPRAAFSQQPDGETLYLPVIFRNDDPYSAFYMVNAPFTTRFVESAVVWMGRVGEADNSTDVRVRYTDTELVVDFAAFDRRIWYNASPSSGALEDWDAATLLLNAGMSVWGVKAILGHRHVDTTLGYARTYTSRAAKEYQMAIDHKNSLLA